MTKKISEAGWGRSRGYNSPMDQERGEQSAMDWDKRNFKRREHEAEWEREQQVAREREQAEAGTWYLRINGKVWRKDGVPVAFDGKRHANAVGLKLRDKNPNREIMLTRSPDDAVRAQESTSWAGHSDNVKNPNFNDELSGRRISPPGKRLKSGKLDYNERTSQERTKALMKFTKKQGGLTGPKGKLPETTEEGIFDKFKVQKVDIGAMVPPEEMEGKHLSIETEINILRKLKESNYALKSALEALHKFKKENGFPVGSAIGGLKKAFGVTEDTPGYVKYEEMKDRIASVLIKLYDKGNDKETILQMGERVAKHLGYDPQDPIYKQAWMSSFTDASLNGDFDDAGDEDDYTDYSMRKGEMGESAVVEGDQERKENRIRMMITDLEQRAKATKNDIKRNHLLQMAQDLRGKLKTSDDVEEARGYVDKNVGKVRKNDVVQTDLKPGDRVIGDMGMGRSVFGTVKRIGRTMIYMVSNNGEEMAFRPEHIELLTPTYWTDKLDAESARRKKFKKEDATVSDVEKIQGTEVTLKNPDGTKTVAPTTMLAKDEKGNLTLNKSAVAATGQTGAKPEDKPITPGAKVNVVSSESAITSLKRLAGL